MDKSVCDERHRQINYRLDVTEKRLNNQSERLDRIELANGRLEERLNNLIQGKIINIFPFLKGVEK